MKKRIPTFLAGMLTTAILGGLGVGALAASGSFTISVDPISIQVNGNTFAPKDVNGADVPVFAYNGTTYAPLRALAEAYGLEVGYDSAAKMATVTDPDAKPTQSPDTVPTPSADPDITVDELKALFKYDITYELNGEDTCVFVYCGKAPLDEFIPQWSALNQNDVHAAIAAWAKEYYESEYTGKGTIVFALRGNSTTRLADIFYDPENGASNFYFKVYNW